MRGLFLDIDTVDRGDLDLAGLRATLPEWTFRQGGAGKTE
jgi:glycerate dehydrogenase